MYLDKLLKTKWKIDADNEEGLLFCNMPEINEKIYLHRLYKTIGLKYALEFEKLIGVNLLPELKEFYKYYNGCRLFHSSINIFGFDVGESAPVSMPLSYINLHSELIDNGNKSDEIVYFGNVGNYLMYYKTNDNDNKIYLSKHGELKVYEQFSSIKDLLQYYCNILIPEYKENGYREHPRSEKIYKNIPVLANSFNGDIDWEVSSQTKEN